MGLAEYSRACGPADCEWLSLLTSVFPASGTPAHRIKNGAYVYLHASGQIRIWPAMRHLALPCHSDATQLGYPRSRKRGQGRSAGQVRIRSATGRYGLHDLPVHRRVAVCLLQTDNDRRRGLVAVGRRSPTAPQLPVASHQVRRRARRASPYLCDSGEVRLSQSLELREKNVFPKLLSAYNLTPSFSH